MAAAAWDQSWATTSVALVRINGLAGPTPNLWVGDAESFGNGDWNTQADWTGDAVPDASATVTFSTGNFGYTVTGDATTAGIVVDGDAVTFTGQISQSTDAGVFLTALSLGQVTIGPDAFLTGDSLAFDRDTLLDVQGVLIANGGTADTVLVDAPNAQLISGAAIQLTALYAQSGGTYAGDLILEDGGNITLDLSSNISGGSVTLLGGGLIYAADAPGGTGGLASFTDNVSIGTGGYLELASDPGVTLRMDGTITGPGFLVVSGGTVELSGDNLFDGGAIAQNGTLVADTYGAAGGRPIFVQDGGFVANVTSLPVGAGVTVQEITPQNRFDVIAIGTNANITAASGSVLAFGSQTGTLTFIGGSNSSTVVGGAGVLVATGGAGGDLLVGGSSGQDVLSTGGGANVLVGGINGDTLIATGAGGGTLVVDGGVTTVNLIASTGTDLVFGGRAESSTNVLGGAGTGNVVLGAGGGAITAGAGTLNVFGGSAAFSLDIVAGGAGNGVMNVVGFDVGQDTIVLSGFTANAAAALLASARVEGGNTYLTAQNGTGIALFGVTNFGSGSIVIAGGSGVT